MEGYIQEEQIGKGSYGKVYKVRSKADQEDLVMKKIALDGTPASEADASVREANLLALLRHPHVVPYREFFKHPDGDLCLVMAYCEGGDLFKYIKQLKRNETQVDEEIAWNWLVQLLLAVSYCHSKKILHRDVKTQNIFISKGKVLLGDFGLAKQLQRTLEMARTPIGTPYYMAPEIYEEQPYSFKSDVWALGCVMYELLAKKPAFAADNLSRVVMRVIRGTYDALPDTYSPELREVINSMLNKSVKKRPCANDILQQHPSVVPRVQRYLDELSAAGSNGGSTWCMKLPPSVMALMALHPSVVPRVQRYLDELSAAGPNGWSTWRMKLPPSVMAQMASVIAQSQASGAGNPPPKRVSESTGDAGKEESVQRRGQRLPQSIEDLMSSTELIEGFSLGSLLLDDRAKVGGKGGGVNPLLAASLHPADVKVLNQQQKAAVGSKAGALNPLLAASLHPADVKVLNQQQKAAVGPIAGASLHPADMMVFNQQQKAATGPKAGEDAKYSELRVISHQLNVISRPQGEKEEEEDEYSDDEHFAPEDGHLNWSKVNNNATVQQAGNNQTLKGKAHAGDDVALLSAGLPAAGFGFGGSGKGFASPISTPIPKPSTPVRGAKSTPNTPAPSAGISPPAPTSCKSSSVMPLTVTVPEPSDSLPRTGYLAPLKDKSYKEMGSGSLQKSPTGSFHFAPLNSPTRPPPLPKEMMTFSIGQISLHETLTARNTWLRKELTEQLGEKGLAAGLKVVSALQVKNSTQDGAGVGDAELRAALTGVVSPAHLELAPLLDELVFIERRQASAAKQ
eukprot:gene12432-15631_t